MPDKDRQHRKPARPQMKSWLPEDPAPVVSAPSGLNPAVQRIIMIGLVALVVAGSIAFVIYAFKDKSAPTALTSPATAPTADEQAAFKTGAASLRQDFSGCDLATDEALRHVPSKDVQAAYGAVFDATTACRAAATALSSFVWPQALSSAHRAPLDKGVANCASAYWFRETALEALGKAVNDGNAPDAVADGINQVQSAGASTNQCLTDLLAAADGVALNSAALTGQ